MIHLREIKKKEEFRIDTLSQKEDALSFTFVRLHVLPYIRTSRKSWCLFSDYSLLQPNLMKLYTMLITTKSNQVWIWIAYINLYWVRLYTCYTNANNAEFFVSVLFMIFVILVMLLSYPQISGFFWLGPFIGSTFRVVFPSLNHHTVGSVIAFENTSFAQIF